jgi:hypothetical protein
MTEKTHWWPYFDLMPVGIKQHIEDHDIVGPSTFIPHFDKCPMKNGAGECTCGFTDQEPAE